MTTEGETGEPAADSVAKLFTDLFPSLVLEASRNGAGETVLTVEREQLALILRQARDKPELGFDFLRCLSGVDQLEHGIELVYSIFSYHNRHTAHIKVLLPLDDPKVASITPFWAGADWHERETAEMFGVTFVGHPHPKHLLLDEDMDIHPLLKAHPLAPVELRQGVNSF